MANSVNNISIGDLFRSVEERDMYSFTARAFASKLGRVARLRVLLACLVTIALQVGLLSLLWQGVLNGSMAHPQLSETDKLWVQAGQTARQLCWLQQHAVMNGSAQMWDVSRCLYTWPSKGACGTHYAADHNWTVAQSCVESSESYDKCTLEPSLKAFADGLFYPREGTAHLHEGGWMLRNVTTDGDKKQERAKTVRASHQECFAKNLAVFPWSDTSTLYPNLFAMLAVAMFAHQEVTNGLWLAYVSGAALRLVPPFFDVATAINHENQASKLNLSCLTWVVLLSLPLVQVGVACWVVFSASVLLLNPDAQTNTLQVVINAVALGFILEIDNKAAALMVANVRHRAPQIGNQVASGSGDGQPEPLTVGKKLLGTFYFSIYGLVALFEPLLILPQYATKAVYSSSLLKVQLAYNAWPFHALAAEGLQKKSLLLSSFIVVCPLLTILLAALFFGQCFPSKSVKWHRTLTVLQLLLMGLVSWAPWAHAMRVRFKVTATDFLRVIVPSVLGGFWLAMFWVWPCCHELDWRQLFKRLRASLPGRLGRVSQHAEQQGLPEHAD